MLQCSQGFLSTLQHVFHVQALAEPCLAGALLLVLIFVSSPKLEVVVIKVWLLLLLCCQPVLSSETRIVLSSLAVAILLCIVDLSGVHPLSSGELSLLQTCRVASHLHFQPPLS